MPLARERTGVDLPPRRAAELWTDVRRWPTFVEGFARVLELAGHWPEEGAKVVWESIPGGRGRVTERVREWRPPDGDGDGRLVTQVFELALTGTQTVEFAAGEDGGSAVGLELDYRLAKEGPLAWLTDLLFIRRALTASLGRTLRRFATEAAEEAGL
jgi:hypothetical protein